MPDQKFILVKRESWLTKINTSFSLLWKILLVLILLGFFLGDNEGNLENQTNTDNADISFTYLDANGLDSNQSKQNLPQIALIDIEGLIAEEDIGSMLEPVQEKRSNIIKKLSYIDNHPEIKGVILRINSPGGTVYDSDLIATEVAKLRQNGTKVVALLEEQATSGGYYIASQADQIIAHYLTLTGSIGSIIQLPNAAELLDKIGVQFNNITSGKMKSMGDFSSTITSEEKAIFQELIDESYTRFLDFVEKGRGIPRAELKKIADGRIYSGAQAQKLNLVDELGSFPAAKTSMETLLDIPDSQIVKLSIKTSPYNFFLETFSQASALFSHSQNINLLNNLNFKNQILFL